MTSIPMPYTIRDAARDDLPAIVAIYNASIPGRLATADTEPVTVASRKPGSPSTLRARTPCGSLNRRV